MSGVVFAGYRPGVLGRLVAWQAEYFAQTHGFGMAFEAKLGREMARFLERCRPGRDLFLTVWRHGRLAGALTLDASDPDDGELAHLRWVFLAPAARGQGLGQAMLAQAIDQARSLGKAGLYLTTLEGLAAATRLYTAAGFVETDRRLADTWGRRVIELRLERRFAA